MPCEPVICEPLVRAPAAPEPLPAELGAPADAPPICPSPLPDWSIWLPPLRTSMRRAPCCWGLRSFRSALLALRARLARCLGVLPILLGVLAVLMPDIAALATVVLPAWLLVLAGVFEVAYAARTHRQPGYGGKVGAGAVTLVLGLSIALLPPAGILSLALLAAVLLLVGGVQRLVLAARLRPMRG